MRVVHHSLHLETGPGINLLDVTPRVRELLAKSGIRAGFVTLTTRHTTTALTVNENEARLLEDVKRYFARLVPADEPYLHNDIHLRGCPPDEPLNAHAHILALLLGSSEVIPVVEGELHLGRWQSVLLVELDGPRERTMSLQLIGE